MKNDIYTMLNDSNINLEDYSKEDFNDIEKKNIKAKFRKSVLKKKTGKRNLVVASLFLALTVTFLGTNVGAEGLTTVLALPGVKDIARFLGIQRNLDEYKTVVNKSVTDNGITVQLNEVILDEKELTVSLNTTSDEKIEKDGAFPLYYDVYVNGKRLDIRGAGEVRNIDNHTSQEVIAYNLGSEDFSGNLMIEIAYSTILFNGEEKKGHWNFKFRTNGDALKIDTKEMLLNTKITAENGDTYTVEKYTDNSLGQKIYVSSAFKMRLMYDLKLRGTDDLGNKVEFGTSRSGKYGDILKLESNNGNLNKDAKILTLIPYGQKSPNGDDEIESEYKQIGEAFTIDLSQLK